MQLMDVVMMAVVDELKLKEEGLYEMFVVKVGRVKDLFGVSIGIVVEESSMLE